MYKILENWKNYSFFLYSMTIINRKLSLQIQTLRDAGLGYKKISNKLNLNLSTVKKNCKRKFELEGLTPKIKRNKCSLNARKPFIIKKFVIANPRGESPLEQHQSCSCDYSRHHRWYPRANKGSSLLQKTLYSTVAIGRQRSTQWPKQPQTCHILLQPDDSLTNKWSRPCRAYSRR